MKRFLPFLLAAALFGTAMANDSKPAADCCQAQAACCQPAQECCEADQKAKAPVLPETTASSVQSKPEAAQDCCAEQQECCVEAADCCPAG